MTLTLEQIQGIFSLIEATGNVYTKDQQSELLEHIKDDITIIFFQRNYGKSY